MLLIVLTVGTCNHKVPTPTSEQVMYFEVDKNFTLSQLDSAFFVEELPKDLNRWIDGTSFIDYESEVMIKQWIYVKNDSTFFILSDLDTIANFKKKVIRTIEQ